MTEFNPKVSIVIPVYNGANFLKESIKSAISQTYKNVEVIVVNDGSTDHGATEEIALSFGEQIKYFSKPNGGVSSALNLGIKNMQGDYFCWLSHDDVYKPYKIEEQLSFLSNECSYDTIIYGGYDIINEKSKVIDKIDFSKIYKTEQLNKTLFPVFRGLANGCTMLIHKEHFSRVGLFDERLRTTQDYDMWFRMFRNAIIKFMPGLYLQSRIHKKQTARTNHSHVQECDQLWINLINQITPEEMIELDGSVDKFYYNTAAHLRMHSNYINAISHIEKLAENLNKSSNKTYVPAMMSKGYNLKKLIYNLKYEGFWNTLIKIKKRLKKF